MNHRVNLVNAVWQFDIIMINNVIALCIFKICEIYNLSECVYEYLSFWLAMRKWEVENFAIYFYSILDINLCEHH